MNLRAITTITCLAFFVLATPGCLVTVSGPAVGLGYGPPHEYGYQPLLYDGYVVYFADDGIPYYWSGGSRIWIPHHARARYLSHWHRYRPAYRNWYKHRGSDYRTPHFNGRERPRPGPPVGPRDDPDRRDTSPRDRARDGYPPGHAVRPRTDWEHRRGPSGDSRPPPDRRPSPRRDWNPGGNPNRPAIRQGDTLENRAGPGVSSDPDQPFPRNRSSNANRSRFPGGPVPR